MVGAQQDELVFRAKNWQIILVYGFFLTLVGLVLVGSFLSLLAKRNAGKDWSIHALQLGLFSLFAIRFGWAILSRIGSRIVVDAESIHLYSWFGRVCRGGQFQDVLSLGIRQTFYKAPQSLDIFFENGKPLKFDAEYEKLDELVKAVEERSGKEFKVFPWG